MVISRGGDIKNDCRRYFMVGDYVENQGQNQYVEAMLLHGNLPIK